MHFYVRLIPVGESLSLEQISEKLCALQADLNEVFSIHKIENHSRGGFALMVNCDDNKQEDFLNELERLGLRPVF